MAQDERRLQLVHPAKPARPLGSDSSRKRWILRVFGLEISHPSAYAIGMAAIAAVAAVGILCIASGVR